jgi:hypothetical protein
MSNFQRRPLPSRYRLWNRVLLERCILELPSSEVSYLSVTPRVLAAALDEAEQAVKPTEEARDDFVGAVSFTYRTLVLPARERLQILGRIDEDGLPACTAFLALSVLAAYEMHADEDVGPNAYYWRLADLLGCDVVGIHPRGFEPAAFSSLWESLAEWLAGSAGRRLAMPGPDVGLRRYVALPLTHVPLRRMDIEKLPEFFAWAGYEPGARVSAGALEPSFIRWAESRSVLSRAGATAVRDQRRPSVVAQVAQELEAWDGSATDALGRRTAPVHILLDVVRRQPDLYYLPRRPAMFPAVFDDGVHVFESGDEGWYDPVRLPPEDGGDLARGFAWEVHIGGARVALQRPGASAIALVPSRDYTGFLSHRGVLRGVACSALCREDLAEAAGEYLSDISNRRCIPVNHPAVPIGWRLFTGVVAHEAAATVPSELDALSVESLVDIVSVGGVRLGRRSTWLAGAPPHLMISGWDGGLNVTIDGVAAETGADGELRDEGLLARPGVHLLRVGPLRRRIEIVEPAVRWSKCRPLAPNEPAKAHQVVTLPPGSWSVIGARPGEVARPHTESSRGGLARCAFEPVWAISVGPGRRSAVLGLTKHPLPPTTVGSVPTGRRQAAAVAWASLVYEAAVRRGLLGSMFNDAEAEAIRRVWYAYFRAARQLKRQWRSRYR